MAGQADQRGARLSKLLHSYINSTRQPARTNDGKLLLEAITHQQDSVGCVERIVASKNALAALKLSLRFDTTPQFLNNIFKDFITLLRDPGLEQACGGELLKQVLEVVVQPPTLWNALVSAHSNKQLTPACELCFAWLVLVLVSWVTDPPVAVDATARDLTERKVFLESTDINLRTIGYRIEHVLKSKDSGVKRDQDGPGGRHDNDHASYRKIAIFPTYDEFVSKQRPFYLPASALNQTPVDLRPGAHLDNQFRLLREDFLAELRDDIKVSTGAVKSRRPRTILRGLSLEGVYCGDAKRKAPFAVTISVKHGVGSLKAIRDPGQRKAFLKNNPKFLKHQSFGCIIDQKNVIAFATLLRVESLLIEDDPIITLRTPDSSALEKLLLTLKTSQTAEFVLVDTPVFAYEPVLRCLQSIVELPLAQELFAVSEEEIEAAVRYSPVAPQQLIDDIETNRQDDLQMTLRTNKSVNLDQSQSKSLLAGLRQSVSLIQGPPGTGKSFIGALLTKGLIDNTREKILVLCYTNHALDQFLEDLLDIGIDAKDMVRLGAKSTARTEPLQLFKQPYNGRRPWSVINAKKEEAEEHESALRGLVSSLKNFRLDKRNLMEYLEFSDNDDDFYAALQMPEMDPDEHIVGEGGRRVTEHYLLDRWSRGQDAGIFSGSVLEEHRNVWSMSRDSRQAKIRCWTSELLQDSITGIGGFAEAYNKSEHYLSEAWDQKDSEVIETKRIVACTTTAAAKYSDQIRSARPGIVVVEEAGEILESHILTALTPSTKQLVLIGDHQQLRPKVNNFTLTVEKGDGYDLNRSLFERLIFAGFPRTTLQQQHRMCPEMSSIVRHLTYPDLVDAPSTQSRDPIRGLSSRVVFIDHRNPELAANGVADRRDEGTAISKQNLWEASMILKVVRYMAQQGYGTGDQAVLTPYLGQLSLLRQELAKENDPILNDLDSAELVRAGLMSPASAAQAKRPIKISTIDNYQGQECDIIIASLTRSNSNGDIGFMSSPERVNVLLSRARKCLIVIGNSDTFLASRKGELTWKPLLKMLSERNEVYDGLPAQCQQHPDREVVLKQPSDFDDLCPDGGCSAPCGTKLSCGIHDCPRKCHALADHTKMSCEHRISGKCTKGHKLNWRCSRPPESCPTCDTEARIAAARQCRDQQLDQARQQKQAQYALQLVEMQDEIDHERRIMREYREDDDREKALRQQKKDLENARKQSAQMTKERELEKVAKAPQVPGSFPSDASVQEAQPRQSPANTGGSRAPTDNEYQQRNKSAAQEDWETQKKTLGARNEELDELMAMIGLENVKDEFLELKAKVDLTVRQSISLSKERFGASLLGNPGTGKTTVARLYGRFLASVGALPGNEFVETTGAKLAHEGVQGCEKILDGIKNNGGGALFIDEAYQLTSGSSFGGGAVLDYLLAEVENLTGKVVFILAGYNKNMEAFFAHNPGLPSRFPRQIQFADYEDEELLDIFDYRLDKQYGGRMRVEDGNKGLYARIVTRRLGRGRGKIGFGNARAVENSLSSIASRQAKRIGRSRRQGKTPDDLLLTKEDLIGPKPEDVLGSNKAWKKLTQMVGLASVKDSVNALFDSIKYNYQRELKEEPIMEFSLNKVFLGSPGTGKTTVAKLYGQILADLGLLSTNEVIVKTPADFVGSVLGASEANTKAILDAAIGKVLVLDEAYGLYSGSDPYKTSVIDTIVAEVQSVPGDDRCVLLLGYKEQMEEMMQKVNPGLARRFPIDSGFLFEDFNDDEMATIFDFKLRSQKFAATETGRNVALEVLSRMRNRPNFGNAGQVDILLNDAKIRQQKRFNRERKFPSATLEAEDFDPDYKRAENATSNLQKLFEGVVGCEGIVAQMQDYQNIAANMTAAGMDPRPELPFTFLFRGPPGTGKTTTARKMGQVYYNMGFLATPEVVECSAKDLIGEYVGQTGPKAQRLIESALGKILFVDEAYRLGEGPFAKEAVDELVDCITKTQYLNKLVIILAGYVNEINRLMDVNPGLSSRFSESVDFQPLRPEDCLQLLQVSLAKRNQIDTSLLSAPSMEFRNQALERFAALSSLANFANGRDVQTIAKRVVGTIMKTKQPAIGAPAVTEDLVIGQISALIAERKSRTKSASTLTPPTAGDFSLPLQTKMQDLSINPQATSGATDQAFEQQPAAIPKEEVPAPAIDETDDGPDEDPRKQSVVVRDAGVSDEVWVQLQQDKQKELEEERERDRLAREEAELKQWLQMCADAKRQRELIEIERKRRELEEKLRLEAKAKQKLKMMGRCPVGFEWIRQSGGYRCAGGSHWVDDGQMEKMMS